MSYKVSLCGVASVAFGFVQANLPTFAELCLAADEKLFKTVIRDNNHVLHKFLPPQSEAFETLNTTISDNADITFSVCENYSHLADNLIILFSVSCTMTFTDEFTFTSMHLLSIFYTMLRFVG